MIDVKANDLVTKTFQLLQQAAAEDPDGDILYTSPGGVRFKAWDLTGCTVKVNAHIEGATESTVLSSSIGQPVEDGQVLVAFAGITAITFPTDADQYRDVRLEFQVTRSNGSKETVPPGGFVMVRVWRDLDGA